MGKKEAKVFRTKPPKAEIGPATEYVVLYIDASNDLDAIDLANEWAVGNGFERARELTLGVARIKGHQYFVARCYRLDEGEIEARRRLAQ